MKFDVITIGTATMDVFLTSRFFKVLKDRKHLEKIGFFVGEAQCFALGSKMEIDKPIFTTGGGATNAAVTFSRQGLKTAVIAKIGNDGAGSQILKELEKEKIKLFFAEDKNKGTAYSTILLEPKGERTILVYRGASEDLKERDIPFGDLNGQWIYISPGKIDLSLLKKIVDYYFKKGSLIAINPSKNFIEAGIKKLEPILRKTKLFILNREEASYFTGIPYDNEAEIFRSLDRIVKGIVAMTDGKNGAMVSDGFNIYKSKNFKEKIIIDRTGAGEAFASGFVTGLIRQGEKCEKGLCERFNIEYAVRCGAANATSVIERVGAKAGILTKNEFEKNKRWKILEIDKYKNS